MLFTRGIDGLNGFMLNGTEYFYKKNMQGDIIAIMDASGNEIVRYVYDAWGNHEIYVLENGVYKKISEAQGRAYGEIAQLNPYRYRGYYYDIETKLYYLNTRYYDPEVGRFINADDISEANQEKINGLNLYAYCSNNPVNYTDRDGNKELPNWLKWLIGGVMFVAGVVLTALTGGALAPVFIGMGISILSSALIGGAIEALNGGSFWQGFRNGAADGAFWGGLFAFGGAALRTVSIFKNGIAIGENMNRVTKLSK